MPRRRPFYHQFAWAYDLLIAEPTAPHVDLVETRLTRQGVAPGSRLLDAGCGTGRYAIELADRGFRVTGIDASEDLIAQASGKRGSSGGAPRLLGDLLELPPRALRCGAVPRRA